MKNRLRRVLTFGIAVMAIAAIVAGPAVVSANALLPADYDNTVNTAVNNQTTGLYRDVIWWGKADPYEQDYINANPNLIATAGSPSRAVVGGDDFAINFTGQRSGGPPAAGQSWITVYDTTPADKTAGTRSLVDFTVPGGVTLKADVLFASPGHNSSGGILAMYDEDAMDGLALLAQHGGGNNHDHARLSLVYQIAGTGTELASIDVDQLFEADTNPGLSLTQRIGSTSGDHWYRLVMNVSVTGANSDQVAVTGSFYNHADPTDPSSATETLALKITDLAWSGTLGVGDLAGKSPATPGEVGLIALTPESFSDGVNVPGGGTGANPLTDNVGVSIIPHRDPTGTPPVIIVKKMISIDGKDPSDPTKEYLDADTYPGPFVPFGTPIWFAFVVQNVGSEPAYNVTLTDSVFNAGSTPAFDPTPFPNPIPGNTTLVYQYGPVSFFSLFPCANGEFLVWGKGMYTTLAPTVRLTVKLGTGTQIYGNVGSVGNIYANGGGQTHIWGSMITDSKFGQFPSQVSGDFIVNNPAWPAVGLLGTYFKPTFVPPPPFPAGPPTPNPLPPGNGKSATLTPGYWAAINGGGGDTLTFNGSGLYFLDALSLNNGTKLVMNVTAGPIHIYVKNRWVTGTINVTVNGGDASDIRVESLWTGTTANPHGFYILGGTWKGDVVCQTSGIMVGNSNTFEGHMWSNFDGQTAANVYKLAIEIGHGVDVIQPPKHCEHHDFVHAIWADASGQPLGPSPDDHVYAFWETPHP